MKVSTNPIGSGKPVACGENLVLRVAGPDDVGELVDFNTRMFDERITHWAADLASGRHPTVQAGDFTVVEDVARGKIVSSVCLISQTWRYGGIPFKVGRPDLVATDPDYRRRGLVRKQFDSIHARSATKGELMQVITGVDWFYRQFGYEMGVGLRGGQCVDAFHLDRMRESGPGGCRLREAVSEDHAFIRDLYDRVSGGQLYSAGRSATEWDLEFTGRSRESTRRREWLIIQDSEGERLGYVQYLPCIALPHLPMFRVSQVEIRPGACYLNLASDLMLRLWERAKSMFANGDLRCDELQGLELALERDHPLYHAMPQGWRRELKPSPWYIRIPDMVALLRRIRPALEKHLVGSVAEGYSGELKLSFYRGGIRLAFERGGITAIDIWRPDGIWQGDAKLPGSSLLQLVCGWRRFHELAGSFADCWGTHEAEVLLDALFPPFNGKVWVLA